MFGSSIRFMFLLIATVPALSSYAHEGHGQSIGNGNTPSHYLTEPLHLFQFAIIAFTVIAIGWVALKLRFSRGSNQGIKLD
jgi:hypothetical protein